MYEIDEDLKTLYLNLDILLLLDKNNYVERVFRTSKYCYATINKKLHWFEEHNFIKIEKKERKNIYNFTEKGRRLLELVLKINELYFIENNEGEER